MSTQGFEPIGEVSADSRGRLPVGRAGVRMHDRFVIAKNSAGDILLTPMASIPKREMLFWEDPTVHEAVLQGLADFRDGRVGPLDDLLLADSDE